MANWGQGRLTKAGRELLAKVEAGKTALNLTCIKIGDGDEAIEEAIEQTDLKKPRLTLAISSIEPITDGCCVSGTVSSKDNPEAFYVKEWGLFANDPDRGEILYTVMIDNDGGDLLPSSSFIYKTDATYAVNVLFSDEAQITGNIDPAGLADVALLYKCARVASRNTDYRTGDILYDITLPTGYVLYCDQGGRTAEVIPNFSKAEPGMTYADGSVHWVVHRLCTSIGGMQEVEKLQSQVERLTKICSMLMKLTHAGDIIGTTCAKEEPQNGTAWIKPDGTVNSRQSPEVQIITETGEIVKNPVACIVYPDGKRLRVSSEWETLDDMATVKAGSAYRIIASDGSMKFNTTVQIIDEQGKKRQYDPTGFASGSIPAESDTVSKKDIDNIFDQ